MSTSTTPTTMEAGQWVGSTTNNKQTDVLITLNIEKRSPQMAQILSYNPSLSIHRSCTTARPIVHGDHIVVDSPETKFFDNDTGALITSAQFLAKHNLDLPLVKRLTYDIKTRTP